MSMVKIKVNNREFEVDSEGNLLTTLLDLGFYVPHFCYHEELGVAGNCRMCLVDVGKKRPQIACDTPITDGLEIKLDSDTTKKVQRSIMEFELVNHPIDCSVCDQVGECSLQDFYMEYDLSKTRVLKADKVKKEKRLNYGAGVIHDQERCVLCTRCVRFTQKITKTNELAVVNRGNQARIGIFPGTPIYNRYAQCIVDVCPVGAMTSEDFRFKKRVFNLKSSDSICHRCSKGCNIYIDHDREKYKKDTIYRYRPRKNSNVNDCFMCDDGRYSYKDENSSIDPRYIYKCEEVLRDEALELFIKHYKNNTSILFLVSNNSSLEELYVINKLVNSNPNYSISAYDEHIIVGDGDNILIEDDKTANRNSAKLLNIPMNKEDFVSKVDNAKLIVTCDVSKFELLDKLLETDVSVISLNSSEKSQTTNGLSIYVKSYSQKDGIVINCNNYLQEYKKAIDVKDTDSLLDVFSKVEPSVTTDITAIRGEISVNVEVFKDIDLNNIPKLGMSLGV